LKETQIFKNPAEEPAKTINCLRSDFSSDKIKSHKYTNDRRFPRVKRDAMWKPLLRKFR